ncbi:TIM-barrel domain-containing protein [Nitrospirillum viridazoti]|uniref:TIM-barrel domain-containing protein n=1 Tax=Nitrospirillum viridazoti TaxID=3144925 RepID=UPI0011AD4489|nr:TIM-barrel domain-containing protein [Nitrospirillum amazonense]TWB30205.1 alpha-D-xyloside xylohydrolase [Nitrospirillum amazonense]
MNVRSWALASAALAPVLLLASCETAKSPSDVAAMTAPSPPFQQTADGVVVTVTSAAVKKVRLQVINDRIVHVTAVPGDSLDLPASLMAVAKPATGGFQVAEHGGQVILTTPQLRAEVSVASGAVNVFDAKGQPLLTAVDGGSFAPATLPTGEAGFFQVRQQFNRGTDEGFYGLGQHQNAQMNYNGEDVELAQHNMDIGIPFVVSTRNYGVLWDNNGITRFGDAREYPLMSKELKLFDADGKEGGLTARYYQDGKLKLTRVESDINYQYIKDLAAWPEEVGGSRVNAKQRATKDKSVVWEGKIESPVDGVHRFQVYASGYFKVTLDGKVVMDRWRQDWNPWYHNFDLPMVAGKAQTLKVEWVPEGGFISLMHQNPLPDGERHELSLTSDVARAIDYYVVAGKDMDDVIAGYRQLTGKAVMMPRWAYGLWQSRQRYKTADELTGTVAEFRKRKLPLDNIVEDWFYWREDDWGSHKFDATRFPDPQGLVDTLHGQNAHFMISVWPKFYPTTDNYKELDAKGHIYRRNVEVHEHDWVGKDGYENAFYDPYSAEARQIYWRQINENLNKLGIDAWWLDASEPDTHSNLDIPERMLRMGPTAMGPSAAFFNSYPLMHTKAVYEGNRAANPDKRAFILTRSGFAGQQRNAAASWSGDVASRWTDLRNQISAGVNFSLSGVPNWTTDIGGFALEKRYSAKNPKASDVAEWRELNLRWFQFGAFSPLFRSHGEFPYREIYNLAPKGSEVYDSLVWYDELRYRLMPYIYTLAADTYHRDGTIMRGLVMDFPADRQVWDINDQYLFGHAFLVAPVTDYRARSRAVYLPSGAQWYDFQTGKLYDGGQRIAADAPLKRMPLFVRAGSIVPTAPVTQYTGQMPDAPLTIVVYTGADGHFDLYEDEGTTYGYEHGAFSRIPLSFDQASGTLTIGTRAGSFPGMVQDRVINVRFVGPGAQAAPADFTAKPDQTVRYTGQAVTVTRAKV